MRRKNVGYIGIIVGLILVVGIPSLFAYGATNYFPRDLGEGLTGNDVLKLQLVLNKLPATRIANSGSGSPGHESTYFGNLTKAAVIRFQNLYTSQILTPAGLTKGTGFVGASTRAFLQSLYTQYFVTGTSGTTVTPDTSTTSNTTVTTPITTTSSVGSDTTYFTNDLSEGMTSDDVLKLQLVLNKLPATKIASTGPGSPGNESTYFGNLTKAAVIKFQNLYASQVLTPSGLTKGNGNVGPSTRSLLKTLYAQYFGGGTSGTSVTTTTTTNTTTPTTPTTPVITTIPTSNTDTSNTSNSGNTNTISSVQTPIPPVTSVTSNNPGLIPAIAQVITPPTVVVNPPTTPVAATTTTTTTTTNSSPTNAAGIASPAITVSCTAGVITGSISWSEAGQGSQGYYVDVDNDTNFSNGYWSKKVSSGTTSTGVPIDYIHYSSEGVVDTNSVPLILQSNTTYSLRSYYVATNQHSPVITFTTPTCSSPVIIQQATSNKPTVSGYPDLGVNLEALSDSGVSMMLADAMKSARSFSKNIYAPWGSITDVSVDANGWPTADFGVLVFTNLNDAQGTYKLSFTGHANVAPNASNASIQNMQYATSTNTSTADVVVTGNQLALAFTNTNGGVKNIKLIRPGDSINDEFDHAFLNSISSAKVLRLMDYLQTNGNPVRNWSDRTKATDALQTNSMALLDPKTGKYPLDVDGNPIANCQWKQDSSGNWSIDTTTCVPYQSLKGGAIEYAIDLANQTNKDLWINIPSEATDDYVTQLAYLLKQSLNSNIHVYLEYSNEVWNGQFAQFALNRVAGKAEIAAGDKTLNDNGAMQSNDYFVGFRRVAQRIMQISNIFKGVYGSNAINTQIRPILATQIANLDIGHQQLAYLQKYYGAPSQFIYGFAGAPYYGAGNANNDSSASVDTLINAMAQQANAYAGAFISFDTLAHSFGVKSISYEGGTDTSGGADNQNKYTSADDPRMNDVTYKYLSQWFGCGGDLFMYYSLSGNNSKYGTWGLTDDIKQTMPKLQGFNRAANTQLNQFQCNFQDANGSSESTTLTSNPGSGSGLSADYFSDNSLTTKSYSEVDPLLAFNWQQALPVNNLPTSFSARWSGILTPVSTGTYTLYTDIGPSDGVRVMVNGTKIIDNWPKPDSAKTGSVIEDSSSISFTSGQAVSIVVEYYHQHAYNGDLPFVQLLWSGPSQPKAVIQASQLSH